MGEHDSRTSNHTRPFSSTQVGPEAPSSLCDETPPSPSATVVLRTTTRRESASLAAKHGSPKASRGGGTRIALRHLRGDVGPEHLEELRVPADLLDRSDDRAIGRVALDLDEEEILP